MCEKPLTDMSFYKTKENLATYIGMLDRKACVMLCKIASLLDTGKLGKLQKRLLRSLDDNLELAQLATVCYCWFDIRDALQLSGEMHPDVHLLHQVQEKYGQMKHYKSRMLRYTMVLDGHMPRFCVKGQEAAHPVLRFAKNAVAAGAPSMLCPLLRQPLTCSSR